MSTDFSPQPVDRRSFLRLVVATGAGAQLAASANADAIAAPPRSPTSTAGAYQLRDVGANHLPYYTAKAGPLVGDLPVDREGIAVRMIGGKAYNHPVLQAQYMMQRLASYQVNHDPSYLASVEAHAARIQSYAVSSGGAAYLPYPFPFNLHGNASMTLPAPWFSGMAQGQALGAFSRLARVTGKASYRAFADRLFASFGKAGNTSVPWAPSAAPDDSLWFEEYPQKPGPGDRAMNGHIFAVFGLYDYWQLTRSNAAHNYAVGGMSAVAAIIDTIRNPGWVSHYCLTHRVTSASYHKVHVGQLYQLFAFTGDVSFAQMADRLLQDYPTAQQGGRAYLGTGDHTVLSFDEPADKPRSARRTLTKAEAASCDIRAKLVGQDGVFIHLTSGTFRNQWVQEIPKQSFIRLYIEAYAFAYPRVLQFPKGTYTGHQFNANGASAAKRTRTLDSASAAHAGLRAICNGAQHYKVLDGIWAGWWIPDDNRVTLI